MWEIRQESALRGRVAARRNADKQNMHLVILQPRYSQLRRQYQEKSY